MNKIELNKLSIDEQIRLFNKYHYYYTFEKKDVTYFKKNMLEPIIESIETFIEGKLVVLEGYFKLKTLSRILHKKRADLTKSNTKQLLAFYKGNKHRRTSDEDYIFYYGKLTSIVAVKKELDNREHIPNKEDGRAIRSLCSQKKLTKSEAIKQFY